MIFTHPGSRGQKAPDPRIQIRNIATLYYTLYTGNHWNSIPPLFLIVQPAEELGLIDGIDQVEAYIQRNYGDQARTGTVYFCCSFCNKLFFYSHDSLFKKEYLMKNLA